MWGYIILENNFINSYHFGFLYNSADVLISLIHWQYWWWFWFSLLISIYYILAIRFSVYRLMKFNPKIVTSYRTHGKWGDIIICFLPISWCINILSNSTSLLKTMEWQSESSLFTIRVRGKQWYWIYKIDNKNLLNSINSDLFQSCVGSSNTIFNSSYFNDSMYFFISKYNLHKYNINNTFFYFHGLKSFNIQLAFKKWVHLYNNSNFYRNVFILNKNSKFNFFKKNKNNFIYSNNFFFFKNFNNSINTELSVVRPIRDSIIKKYVNINKNYFNNNFKINFSKKNFNDFISKKFDDDIYTILKQVRISGWQKLSDFSFDDGLVVDNLTIRIYFINNNKQNFLYNNTRLLRVNKILILPTNTFINVITNSFDVIHSWFIPGLGFKMDCVPGRSTHHTLYIDTPGMYYGQCAEICGRFHHHMPIKIGALNFNHFYLWWMHTVGNTLLTDSIYKEINKKIYKILY